VWIDRADLSRTVSHLYAPAAAARPEVPAAAWTEIVPPIEAPPAPRRRRKDQ
jgi:hypothetical protein